MYEIFMNLLKKEGITAYRVSKATGIAGSTFTDWKNGRSTPKQDKLQKIADFFGVSLEYLMTGKEESEKKESEITAREKRLMEYAQKLLDLGVDPDALEALIDAVEGVKKK